MVSGAPRSTVGEIDKSQIWTENSGLGVYLGIPAEAGPLEPTYVQDYKALLNLYTVEGKLKSSDDISFAVAKRMVNATGIGLIVNRVAPDNVLYGGCVVPCGTTAQARSLSTGLANPLDFTFNTGTGAVAEQVNVIYRADVNGNFGGTAFYLPGLKYLVSYTIEAVKESCIFTCLDDINKSLNSTFIILPGGAGYAWFNVDSTGTDPGASTPSLAGLQSYPIAISEDATADGVATALIAGLANITGIDVTAVTDQPTQVQITVQTAGITSTGSAGSSGFTYSRVAVGAEAIEPVQSSVSTVIPVTIKANDTAVDIATATYTALQSITNVFTATVNGNTLTATAVEAGILQNAKLYEASPAPVEVQTTRQGSSSSGTDAVFFYFNNPSAKAQQYGIKLYNSDDYPDIATVASTFVVEIYTKSNPTSPISTITCSRDKDAIDEYGRSIFVEKALERVSDLRALNNPNLVSTELPRSITDILWLGGGSSGSFTPGTTEKLNAYIKAAQPLVDVEEYAVSLLLPGGFYATPYLQELDRIAQKRGEAVQLSGIPTDYETSVNYMTAIQNWMEKDVLLTSSYSAIFTPALKAYDSDLGQSIILPVEAGAAEQIAYTNENYSISEPILGFKRGTLQQITGTVRKYSFSQDGTADGDKLYDLRINPIRYFKNRGYVIWGQKTTQSISSALDRLNVRLMLISLKPLINNIQLGAIGELPTPATKEDLLGQLGSVFDVGVGRNWFKDNYTIELVEDATLEAQHIKRIYYTVEPYNAIEYVDGYIVITNGIVTAIS